MKTFTIIKIGYSAGVYGCSEAWKNINNNKQYRFKKGRTGHRRISQHEREVVLKRINEVNKNRKPEACPVCKMIYQNVDSHLSNKHNLIRV